MAHLVTPQSDKMIINLLTLLSIFTYNSTPTRLSDLKHLFKFLFCFPSITAALAITIRNILIWWVHPMN